jgi:hypothetical protein
MFQPSKGHPQGVQLIHQQIGQQNDSPDVKRNLVSSMYKGADKSLALPGRKQAIVTEDFDVHISYLLS